MASFQQFATMKTITGLEGDVPDIRHRYTAPEDSSFTKTNMGTLVQCQSVQITTPSFSCLVSADVINGATESYLRRLKMTEEYESGKFRVPTPPPDPRSGNVDADGDDAETVEIPSETPPQKERRRSNAPIAALGYVPDGKCATLSAIPFVSVSLVVSHSQRVSHSLWSFLPFLIVFQSCLSAVLVHSKTVATH